MKAAVYYETGGPDVFRYEDVADPTCGPGEVLIRVEAVSIEGGDTLNRLRGDLGPVPHVVGYQCAGVVLEVGDGVDDLAPGDRAVTVGVDGSHAELRVTGRGVLLEDPRRGVHRGGGLCAGAVRDGRRQPVRVRAAPAGETVLVHAGASGVGIAAIQLANAPGPGCWPRPRRPSGWSDWCRWASTRASTTRPPTSPRRSGG